MSRKPVGRGFKVTRKDVDGYGYARPRSGSMRSNPGVTTIAAINGRGAFAARKRTPTRSLSARQTMAGLGPRQRKNRASALTNQERSQFSKRVKEAREKAMKRKGTRRRNAAPSAKQLAARKRFAAMARSGALKRKRNSRKRTAAKRPAKRKRNATKSLFSRVIRRKNAGRVLRKKKTGTKKRRSAAKRTTTVKRRRRRVAAKTPVKRRRRRAAKRTTVRRKRRRVAARKTPVRRKRRKNGRRRVSRRRNAKRRVTKRGASKRRVTKRRAPARRRKRSSAKRRTAPRRRRVSKKRRANSRRRRNSSGFFGKLFRRNPAGLVALAAVGAGGYFAHRLGANLISMALAKMPSVAPYSGVVGSVLTAVAGIPLVLKVVDDVNVKQSLVTGMFVSAVQGVIVGLLKASSPAVAEFLSGDDTAAKLSAMYGFRGLGQGTSIMPRYAPINGMGEYFAAPMGEYFAPTRPMGEYFATPMGEYFESGVEGLGNYTGNPYAMQAAAGYGAAETANTNHVDPSSNLDHELTIAEAAAGVGQMPYQAAAGIPRYEAQAGFGDVETVPSASTWIPGSADPQIWAGVRAIDRSQEDTAETAAGVLATPGGAGILG
jgi:hypothetical protein